jgi:hypothetical protein
MSGQGGHFFDNGKHEIPKASARAFATSGMSWAEFRSDLHHDPSRRSGETFDDWIESKLQTLGSAGWLSAPKLSVVQSSMAFCGGASV